MATKRLILALLTTLAVAAVPHAASAQEEKIKIGFLPGVVDPFYQVMQLGVEAAAEDLGLEVVKQIPQTWASRRRRRSSMRWSPAATSTTSSPRRRRRTRWSARCRRRSTPASR